MGLSSTKTVDSQWMVEADRNLLAGTAISCDPRLFGLACYHSHQAAEKALKAYLIRNGKGLLRIHDIEYLIMVCMRKDPVFRELIQDGIYLNPFYVEVSYPILDPIKLKRDIPRNALKAGRNIVGFIKKRLSRPVPGQPRVSSPA